MTDERWLESDAEPDRREDIPDEDLRIQDAEGQAQTQDDLPLEAELGDAGQGDLAPEDLLGPSGDAPEDLRVDDGQPPRPVETSTE